MHENPLGFGLLVASKTAALANFHWGENERYNAERAKDNKANPANSRIKAIEVMTQIKL